DAIARAVASLPCPVLANGNIDSVTRAETVWRETQAHGLMIGRGAVRNPWLFQQIRQHLRGEPLTYPTGQEVLTYIQELYAMATCPGVSEAKQVERMKKY